MYGFGDPTPSGAEVDTELTSSSDDLVASSGALGSGNVASPSAAGIAASTEVASPASEQGTCSSMPYHYRVLLKRYSSALCPTSKEEAPHITCTLHVSVLCLACEYYMYFRFQRSLFGM